MRWQPGKSPFQQFMHNTRAQAQQRRNLEGGYWWLQQQKAKLDEQLLKYPWTRRTSLSSRVPLSLSELGRESSPVQLGASSQQQSRLRIKPAATIHRTWTEHNTALGGLKGMHIHTSFSVRYLLLRTGTVAAYFFYADGVPLKDFNQYYYTTSGTVCAARPFTPPFLNTQYNDFVLFMPYDELHMAPGKHNLKYFVEIWAGQRRELAWTDWIPFIYTCG